MVRLYMSVLKLILLLHPTSIFIYNIYQYNIYIYIYIVQYTVVCISLILLCFVRGGFENISSSQNVPQISKPDPKENQPHVFLHASNTTRLSYVPTTWRAVEIWVLGKLQPFLAVWTESSSFSMIHAYCHIPDTDYQTPGTHASILLPADTWWVAGVASCCPSNTMVVGGRYEAYFR